MTSADSSIEQRLRAYPTDDTLAWRHAAATLARRADAEGLVDVAFERHDSPLGSLLVVATDAGLVRIGLPNEAEERVLDALARRVSGRVLQLPRPVIMQARTQLDEYFDARRTRFDVQLDWRLSRGFRREVLAVTAEIPYGRTASYSDVAARAGRPRAVRAAGTALATNPLPIVVPCHRVVLRSGALGAYGGGPEAKARLLALETRSGATS